MLEIFNYRFYHALLIGICLKVPIQDVSLGRTTNRKLHRQRWDNASLFVKSLPEKTSLAAVQPSMPGCHSKHCQPRAGGHRARRNHLHAVFLRGKLALAGNGNVSNCFGTVGWSEFVRTWIDQLKSLETFWSVAIYFKKTLIEARKSNQSQPNGTNFTLLSWRLHLFGRGLTHFFPSCWRESCPNNNGKAIVFFIPHHHQHVCYYDKIVTFVFLRNDSWNL